MIIDRTTEDASDDPRRSRDRSYRPLSSLIVEVRGITPRPARKKYKRHSEWTGQCPQPRRYKLALLTFVGLLAPVYFIPPALSAVFTGPRLLTVSAAVAGIVALMTYVIMPVLTKLTAGWLFKQPARESHIPGSEEL